MVKEEEFVSELGPDTGKISISRDVIATIAGLAAAEVEGIAPPKGEEFPRGEGARRLVEVQLTDGHVRVAIKVAVIYGHPIGEVAQALQEKIKEEIEKMTALPVDGVDVEVVRVVFTEEEAAGED